MQQMIEVRVSHLEGSVHIRDMSLVCACVRVLCKLRMTYTRTCYKEYAPFRKTDLRRQLTLGVEAVSYASTRLYTTMSES
jgi:hypothetical protein